MKSLNGMISVQATLDTKWVLACWNCYLQTISLQITHTHTHTHKHTHTHTHTHKHAHAHTHTHTRTRTRTNTNTHTHTHTHIYIYIYINKQDELKNTQAVKIDPVLMLMKGYSSFTKAPRDLISRPRSSRATGLTLTEGLSIYIYIYIYIRRDETFPKWNFNFCKI